MPAHMSGAASASDNPAGTRASASMRASMYSAYPPSDPKPLTSSLRQVRKSPTRHESQTKSCPPCHPTPTRSPGFQPSTPGPIRSMTPTTSCPGTLRKLQTRELSALHEAVAVTDAAGGDPDLDVSRPGCRALSRDDLEIGPG